MAGVLAIVERSIDFVEPTGRTLHFASKETDDEASTIKRTGSDGLKTVLVLLNISVGVSQE
jgi:hypothetical protein